MNFNKNKRFFLQNISIGKKLPYSIFLLLFIVIASLTTVAYIGVRNTSLQVGEERLKALTEQFAALFGLSTQRVHAAMAETAASKYVRQFLQSPKSFNAAAIEDSLNNEFALDTLTLSLEIWSAGENLLLRTNDTFSQYEITDTIFNKASSGREVLTGKIHFKNDSMFYPIISSVIHDEQLVGYLVRWRLIKSTNQSIKQITGLLGENASLYLGNDDGSLWTDLVNVTPAPVAGKITEGYREYNTKKGEVIAGVHSIEGTPWLFIIELPKAALLHTADKLLLWLLVGGGIVLLLSTILSVVMSRNITTPLNKLTAATTDIAKGNYEAVVEFNREDEIGRLAHSFNTMVVKVRGSKKELEKKVHERTIQLKSANEELSDLNFKLKEIDEIKTNFFTNISHELRTPLALILGPVERMISFANLKPSEIKELQVIQQNARVLLKHVNDLLDLSKLEVGKLKLQYTEFDFTALVRMTSSYFESLAREERITIKIDAPPSLTVQADFGKIERILMNLFSNAFKYSPADGMIQCKVYKEDGNNVNFEIMDSGQGIKPEFINSIFERFSSGFGSMNRNIGSSGLGLSIVKEFIDMHRGTITAFNSAEGGAVFKFSIPVTAPAESKVTEEIQNQSSTGNSLNKELSEIYVSSEVSGNPVIKHIPGAPTILVIEDNTQLNRFIVEILNEIYNVITAFNGEEGLTTAKQYIPDLILTDVMMPGMSGDVLVEKLLADNALSSIPIVLLTAKANEQLKVDLLKKGAYDYLNKPFSIEELKARLSNILMIKSARDQMQEELQSHVTDVAALTNELVDKKNSLEDSLKEKEILIKEIHHRVKNNLQIISSLLSLQSAFIEDEGTLKTLVESQNRIRSMALVHEQLYNTKDISNIDTHKYVSDLVEHLIRIYHSSDKNISSKVKVDDIRINIDTATSIGLIINELVTNSLKYAFNGRGTGELLVSFTRHIDDYVILVKDNGHGIRKETDLNGSTFGLMIVESLTSQLHGNFTLEASSGTEAKIIFPVEIPEEIHE